MTGWTPWAVLGVPEGSPITDVQRAFRREVKRTHPDSGGNAAAFEAVMSAFDEIREILASTPLTVAKPSSPYDQWTKPEDSNIKWVYDTEPAPRPPRSANSAPVTHLYFEPTSDFSSVLIAEMARAAAA